MPDHLRDPYKDINAMLVDNDPRVTADVRKTVICGDGYRLKYRVWQTPARPSAVLVFLSGMMSHSGWFSEVAGLLAESEVKVVGADRRGSGLNDLGRGHASSRQALLHDLRLIIEQERCDAPVYLAGWCWGAVLAVNAALEFGRDLAGLLLLAPGLYASEPVQLAADAQCAALNELKPDVPALASPITERMFTESLPLQAYIRNDPLAVRRFTANFFRVARSLSWVAAARLPRLAPPVFLMLADDDQAVDNGRTLQELRRLPDEQLAVETLPAGHGMQLEAPHQVFEKILIWIQSRVTAQSGEVSA